MQFTLYDRWGAWLSPLDGVVEWKVTHSTTGGEGSLELVLAGNTVHPAKGERIVFEDGRGWNECVVQGVTDTDDGDGRQTEVYAEDSICELRCKYVADLDGGASSSNLLPSIVSGTTWVAEGEGTATDYHVREVTAMEALVELAEAQEGVVVTRIEVDDTHVVGRHVSIVPPSDAFSGVRFDYGRNIDSVERIVEEDDVFTRIIATGGSYTAEERVWDEEIHDWLWKDVTRDYEVTVQDDSLLPDWGWPAPGGGRRHSEMRWSDSSMSNANFDGVEGSEYSQRVQDALERSARKELAANGPRISYRADVELFGASLAVGDRVQVHDPTFSPPLLLETTVVQTVETQDGMSVTLGSFASTLADTVLRTNETLTAATTGSSTFWS